MLQHVQIRLHMISRAQHTCEIGIGRRAPKPGYAAVRPLPGPLSGPFVLKLEHGYHHLPVSALLTAKRGRALVQTGPCELTRDLGLVLRKVDKAILELDACDAMGGESHASSGTECENGQT